MGTDKTAEITRIDRGPAADRPAAGSWQSDIGERVESLESFVRQRPVLAAACAIGLGFAASLVFAKLASQDTRGGS